MVAYCKKGKRRREPLRLRQTPTGDDLGQGVTHLAFGGFDSSRIPTPLAGGELTR